MGLGVGIMHWEEVAVPKGIVYEFAREMAVEGADWAYMASESQSYIPFTQRQTLEMLRRFAKERGLSASERREIRTWLKSLPWIEGGWLQRLPAGDGRTREWGYRPLLDNCDRLDGGLIELHFSW